MFPPLGREMFQSSLWVGGPARVSGGLERPERRGWKQKSRSAKLRERDLQGGQWGYIYGQGTWGSWKLDMWCVWRERRPAGQEASIKLTVGE